MHSNHLPPCTRAAWTQLVGVVLGVVLVGLIGACGKKKATRKAKEIVVSHRGALPKAPTDASWDGVPSYDAKLILQDLVEPRQLKVTTEAVTVQAVSDGRRIAFRLVWKDSSKNDLLGSARFSDACAVQLPSDTHTGVPDPQMGHTKRPVEIAYWRASWQAVVNGRKDNIKAIYPGAAVDHYPFEAHSLKKRPAHQKAMARRYSPSRALGNRMGGPRKQPVQDLLAEGPGTLHPAKKSHSVGHGQRSGQGWAVVIDRPLPVGLQKGHQRTHIAFAIWDGGHREVGARKMRSGWIPITLDKGVRK